MIKIRNLHPELRMLVEAGFDAPQPTNTYKMYVDYDNGSDSNTGRDPDNAKKTIQAAVTAAGAWWSVYVFRRTGEPTGTDPYNYAETVIIPRTHEGLRLIGVGSGRTQGGLPQMKINTGSTAMITVRAPNCLIANMGFNGLNSTGGGILLDDDSGATKTAYGTIIQGCHFKNCVGSTATNAATGGAIMWSANGQAMQVLIYGNRFYKNVGDIVLLGTSEARPQDVIIENNHFSGPAANVDCNVYLAGGSGINGVHIHNNVFPCWPALSTGTNQTPLNLTGCVGILSNNVFGFLTQGTGLKTFKAAGDVKIPTTVFMAGNYGQADTEGDTGYVFLSS